MSDLEKFDEAYTDFGALTKGVDPRTLERDGSANPNEEVPGIDRPGGMKALHSLANVPKSWPLARLTIPLSAASKHLERLLEGCCNEIYVRNTNPDLQLNYVRKFAKDLVVVLAFHLAETIAALFRHVLHHPSKVLYDPETEPLFLPLFWFYPIYREMLNSASRHRPSNVKTTLERCGPFSLVVLSQRRSQVTSLSGHSDQNASETFSNKLQLNKVQSSLRQTSAKTTQVRSKAKTS